MKKFIFLISFLTAIGVQTISAQVPGYQGKRFYVGYNASTFFYITDFQEGILGAIESTRLSYKTEVNVNYVLSRKVSAGFSFYHGNQSLRFAKQELQTGYGYSDYMEPKHGFAPCKFSIYEIHFQVFKKNFIAPVGLYQQFSVGIVKFGLGTSDNKLTIYNTNNQSYSLVLDGPKEPYSCFKLGYGIGKNNPIGHNFYLNTAFAINLFVGGDMSSTNSGILNSSNYTVLTPQNYILANFSRGLKRIDLFEIKLGLGWLAF